MEIKQLEKIESSGHVTGLKFEIRNRTQSCIRTLHPKVPNDKYIQQRQMGCY